MEKQWVLGIDGGGTKTDAILVATDGSFGAAESAGPSNLNTVGVERAARIVLELTQKCCLKVACGPEHLFAVGIGLAGAGRTADRVEFNRSLLEFGREQDFPLSVVVVETDWRIALEAAFPTGPGIVLIAGSGSIACARGDNGRLYRAGGWGRILGDEGSGFVLGRDALNAALRAYEGRGDQTILLEYALQHFVVSSVDELMGKIYREHVDVVSLLAGFAPKVLYAEAQRDTVAHNILMRGANELADIIRGLVMQIRPNRKLPVAMMGGLLDNENVYSNMGKETILRMLPQVVIQKPKFPPAYGAAILAFQPFTFPP